MSRITVFLSHSSKDIEKVRKIRDILEAIEYEPLLFYLKCLDDDNEQLEEFIKKEIEARNVFIYCKSENAEKSLWVQKELEYIKAFNVKRLYEIDIEKPFNETLVTLLQSIASILKKNRVFISCSHHPTDDLIGEKLKAFLSEKGYEVFRFRDINSDNNSNKSNKNFSSAENGVYIPIISHNSLRSMYCMFELNNALISHADGADIIIFPLFLNIDPHIVDKLCPFPLNNIAGMELSDDNFDSRKDDILKSIIEREYFKSE